MAEHKTFRAVLYMKPLPKPEYRAMKQLVEHFGLQDDSECFAMLIRLAYEVCRMEDGQGMVWVMNVIDNLRHLPEKERLYGAVGT